MEVPGSSTGRVRSSVTERVAGGHPVRYEHVVRMMPAKEGLDACPKALVAAAGAVDVG